MNYPGKLTATLVASLVLAAGCSTDTTNPSASAPPESAAIVTEAPASEPATTESATPLVQAATETQPAEPLVAQAQAVRYFVDGSGLAIRGTDPVAYFTQGGPVAGSSEFTHNWNNAIWQFASAENRDLFAANPEQYAPQYGGFCAWAVSQGYTAAIDPNAWKIVDGKLYLNFNRSVQQRWERDIPGNISKANANWPSVLSES